MARGVRRSTASAALLALAVTLGACGSDTSELTTEQLLQTLEGRSMTAAEIDDQLELADLLCGFQGKLLDQIWARLDARQLEFQDYVFGQHCPDRLPVYEAARPETGTAPIAATTSTTIDASLLDKVRELPPSTAGSSTSDPATSDLATTTLTTARSTSTSTTARSTSTSTTARSTTTSTTARSTSTSPSRSSSTTARSTTTTG